MIIHISGAPGSGKTTIGNWIQNNFKNTIVHDIDDLYNKIIMKKSKENIKNFSKTIVTDFQKYIDNIISRNKNKNLVFVGLNYPDPRIELHNKEIFLKPFKLNMRSDYNFYIDIPIHQIIKQYFKRTLAETLQDSDNILEEIMKNKEKKYEIDLNDVISDTIEWKKMFKKDNYIMIGYEPLKNRLAKLLK